MQKPFLGALCASAVAFSAASGLADTAANSNAAADSSAAAPAMQMAPANADVQLGDLTLSAPFARATLPNAPVAGGFLTITNNGARDDRLVAVRADDVAGRAELHEMTMEGDVMKMRQLADGLPIPAGQTVELKPGGYHIMFMDLKAPLVEGTTINVTLVFEKGEEVELPFAVGPRNARTGNAGQGQGGSHAGH